MDLNKTGFNHDEDYGSYGSPDPIPAGEYKCMIVESEERQTKAGTGSYLRLVLEVIEGEHKGRKLFENLNLENPNPIAVRIAMAELKQITNACGGLRVQNSTELHSIPMIVKVGQKRRDDTGDMQNDIKAFKPVAEGMATTAAAPVAAGAKASDSREAPWKKK